jgi:predicted amidohydrolase YtcJ
MPANSPSITAALAFLAFAGIATAQPADLVLTNGRIVTLDARSWIADSVAVRGDRIVAVGSAAEVRAAAGPATRTIDLGGRTVIPGLIDSHIHAIRAGLRSSTETSFIGTSTISEAMDRIRLTAARTSGDAWIVVGGGWTPGQFAERRRPTLSEIGEAAPGRRVYIQLFYRGILLSDAAMRAFGIADETTLPKGAKFETDEGGRPNGWISGDTSAITTLYERLPHPDERETTEGTQRFFAELNRHGVTGIIDPGGHNLAPDEYETLMRLWQSGGLTLRVAYSISAPRPGSELADLKALTQFLPMGIGDGMLRFNGIGERVTWALYNNDTPTEDQIQAFRDVARWAAGRGLTLTAHWNNDRSVHHLLDIFERIDRETPIRGLRWSIAHLHDASTVSLQRMKALGVGWLMQNGLYFAASSFVATRPGIERSPPIKTALELGVQVGGGTDAHRVMSYHPFVSLRWMIDGRTIEGLPTRNRAELTTREEALRLYTQGSAWFAFDEASRGTIEAGRLADLAVLDRDYLTVPLAQMGATRALLTMVGGRIVHAAGPFEGTP